MQHEDRILKSIDLLTYNARETLNKYFLWATSPDSDITFNLYDALPSYSKNGATGSGAFIKPIKVPSFNSIASGIFGPVGTTSNRDIYWNFNFLANGSGWVFDEYVKSNNGLVDKNLVSPKLDIRTDVSFGKSGKNTSVLFNSNKIKYTSNGTNVEISPDIIDFRSNGIFISGVDSNAVAVISSANVSIGTDIASFLNSSNSSFTSFTETISNRLDIASNNIIVRGFNNGTKSYDVLKSSNSDTTLGDVSAHFTANALSLKFNYSQSESFGLYTYHNDKSPSITLLSSNPSANDSVDVDFLVSTTGNFVKNLVIGGNSASNGILAKLSALTSEGFQLFTKSTYSPNVDKSKVSTYFDAWVDAGIDSSKGNRSTSSYSNVVDGFIDPVLINRVSNPYYFNLGTSGDLVLTGKNSSVLESNGTIEFRINNSPEILVSSGVVTIPNLNIPKLANTSLSTFNRSSFLNFNSQVSLLPFGKLDMHSNGVISYGMEISTDIANNYELFESNQLYIWTTFHSFDGTTFDYYTFYLVDSSNPGYYKLMCEAIEGTVAGPDYSNTANVSTVFDYLPKNTVKPTSNTAEKFDRNQIEVTSSGKSVYVIYAERGPSKIDTVSIYSTSNAGVSFTKKSSTVTVPSVFAMDSHAISYDDIVCSCGIKDKLWISLETLYQSNTNMYTPVILCYDEISDVIYSVSISTQYDDRVTVEESESEIYKTLTIKGKGITEANPILYQLDRYSFGQWSMAKIFSVFDGTDYSAYLSFVVTNGLGVTRNKLIKLTLDTPAITVSSAKTIPLVGYAESNKRFAISNDIIINVTGTVYTLHSIYSTFDVVGGNIYTNPTGHYGDQYSVSWDEATGFNAGTITGTGTFARMTYSSDHRYILSQAKGWTNIDKYEIISNFSILKVANKSIFQYISKNNSSAALLDVASITLLSASLGINDSTGSVYPLAPRDIVVDNDIVIVNKYNRSGTMSIPYSGMDEHIKTSIKTNGNKNSYDKFFKDSFIDMFGCSIYENGVFSTIFSNNKTGKYTYSIGNYDTTDIGGKVYVNTNGSEISELFLQNTNTTFTNYFREVNLNNDQDTPLNSTNISLKKDGLAIAEVDSIIPVSIYASSFLTARDANYIGRNGVFETVKADPNRTLDFNYYDPLGVGADAAKNVLLLPVEIASIFAKRASQGNKTNIVRSDFSLTFVNTNTVSGVAITGNASDFIMASVTWFDDVNSGHIKPWLFDQYYYSKTYGNDEVHAISNEAYSVRDEISSIIPYNSSIHGEFVLIYDKKYNRTHVIAKPSSYVVAITDTKIELLGSAIVMSISNTVINPFDNGFDSTVSLINEAGNVISIGIDSMNTLSIRNVKGNKQSYSGLLVGYTRTNFVEGSC